MAKIHRQVASYLVQIQKGRLKKSDACRRCGQPGHLRWHGHYTRSLIVWAKTYLLPIKRLYCTLCRRTFGLLPVFIAKFHRYAQDVISSALKNLKRCTYEHVAGALAQRCQRYVATLTLYFWRRKFT